MRVLLVDDDVAYAPLIAQELRAVNKFDVVLAPDPYRARLLLQREEFDVVVVDIRYGPLSTAYERRRTGSQVSLLVDSEFLISGLTTLYDAASIGRRPGSNARATARRPGRVVWTIGEGSRGLQMPFAQQELGVSVFCSKQSRRLSTAIGEAEAGRPYIDLPIASYLPKTEWAPIRELFEEPVWPSIWPALALRNGTASHIAAMTGERPSIVRNHIGRMRDKLVNEINPNIGNGGRSAMPIVRAYAESNWEFFLDDLVMRFHPPQHAEGFRGRRITHERRT